VLCLLLLIGLAGCKPPEMFASIAKFFGFGGTDGCAVAEGGGIGKIGRPGDQLAGGRAEEPGGGAGYGDYDAHGACDSAALRQAGFTVAAEVPEREGECYWRRDEGAAPARDDPCAE